MRRKWVIASTTLGLLLAAGLAMRQSARNGFAPLLGSAERRSVVGTALLSCLPAEDYSAHKLKTYLHTNDDALTLNLLEDLRASGRIGILPLLVPPERDYHIVLVTRVNEWWPSRVSVRVSSYTGIDFPGTEYTFRRTGSTWSEVDRRATATP